MQKEQFFLDEYNPVFPKMARIRQALYSAPLTESVLVDVLQEEFSKVALSSRIHSGQTIAISAGSRGIASIPLIIRTLADLVKAAGAVPFVFPAMGSHGSGTDKGQMEVLTSLGITPQDIGCEIRSSMQVTLLGQTARGLPVYLDKNASEADGIIIVNRIKPHTDFTSEIESGLMKMIAIGLGKDKQARIIHSYGVRGLKEFMPEVARAILASDKIIAGFAILEDGYHHVARIAGVSPDYLEQTEIELLETARRMMPSLPVTDIDILIVERIGKDISGTGMDTNIVGRKDPRDLAKYLEPRIRVIIALDLSEESHGNATGIGLADLTVRRLVNKIDFKSTYLNALTGQRPRGGALPIIMENDRQAIHTALTMLIDPIPANQVRMIRIRDTLTLDEMEISEAVFRELSDHNNITLLKGPVPIGFDQFGNLF